MQKVRFHNQLGQELVGQLELPLNRHPHNTVLFAHCFTCGKSLTAIRLLSQALADQGFAVLRFDFTGLGESAGEFADTTFSNNVLDLVCAANYLDQQGLTPTVIVGHSLGGAAAILAATQIESVRAVATVGAPAEPHHVQHLFANELSTIEQEGASEVNLAGRKFVIKQEFVDDLHKQNMAEVVHGLRKPLLIMHAPQDTTVGIENAEKLYRAALHPKSFVSLDQADHLLMRSADARYVGQVIAGWAQRYVDTEVADKLESDHQVVASLSAEDGFTTHIRAGKHNLMADEPASVGGNDFGPSPYELLSSSLAACTVMTLHMYARHKKLDLQRVEVHINHQKDYIQDCEECLADGRTGTGKIDQFVRELRLIGNLTDEQRQRLVEIADKCPVHKTLHNPVHITTHLMPDDGSANKP